MPPQNQCRKCVVCGIRSGRDNNTKRRFMARFPLNEERCKMWVQSIGIEGLAYMPIENLHKTRFVCGYHFKEKDFNKKKSRLKRRAIPSVNIPSPPLDDHTLKIFPRCNQENSPMENTEIVTTTLTDNTMKEQRRKCVKCGSSPATDPEIVLYRFPRPGSTNTRRSELWAKYAYPDHPWSNTHFQMKLYKEHRMLCHRHFKETAFIDYSLKKLHRFAYPEVEVGTESFQQDDDVRSLGSPSSSPDKSTDLTFDVYEPLESDIVIPLTSQTRVDNGRNTDNESKIVFNIETSSNTNLKVPEAFGMDVEVPWTSDTKNVHEASNCEVPGTFETTFHVPIASNVVVPRASETGVNFPEVTNCVVPWTSKIGAIIIDASNFEVPGVSKTRVNIREPSNYEVPGTSTRMNVPEVSDCKKHIQIIKKLNRRIKCLENKNYLAKLTTNDAIKKLVGNISEELKKGSLKRQVNKKVNIKSERWTHDDKIRALRLYKQSPSYYRLMRQMFELPSPSVVLDFILKRVQSRKDRKLRTSK